MSDRTQLTEALRVQAWRTWTPEEWNAVVAAAQKWADLVLDFPTNEQVEAAARAVFPNDYNEGRDDIARDIMRQGLEAVRQTMIGDTDD